MPDLTKLLRKGIGTDELTLNISVTPTSSNKMYTKFGYALHTVKNTSNTASVINIFDFNATDLDYETLQTNDIPDKVML